jgi:flagellar FliL protein
MSDAKKNPDEGGDQGEKPKRDLGKLFLPIFAVLNLACVGGGAFLVYKSTLGYVPPAVEEAEAMAELQAERKIASVSPAVMYTMPSFTVNLGGYDRRLIRVEMTFEMLDKDGFEEIVRNSPQARDAIVRILNTKTFDDVETVQGKLSLKDQIAVTLNQSMKTGVIKDIYFSDFLVQ